MQHESFHRYLPPVAVGASWEKAAERSAAVCEEYKFDPLEDDLLKFVRRLGGKTEIMRGDHGRHLNQISVQIESAGKFIIYLSGSADFPTQRFHLAHELGHYFLHTGTPVGSIPIATSRAGDSDTEREANRFAACFLIPRAPLLSFIGRMGNNSELVALHFAVPEKIVLRRMESLLAPKPAGDTGQLR